MKKVFITGASGFLGTKLFAMYANTAEVSGTYHKHPKEGLIPFDVTDAEQTREVITRFHPDNIIHTVALADVDICEERREDAEIINYLGTKNVVDAACAIGARVDYISTVYVFNGEKGQYTEEDEPNPMNWYGETKLRAEREVATLPHYGIYRFDKLYGYNGEGKPNDAFSKVLAGKLFQVNSNSIRQPLFIDDVDRGIQFIQERNLNGIFHMAGPEKMSKYDLTIQLAKLIGKESLVIPILEKEQVARRPKDASIVTTKAESLGIRFTPLQEAIDIIETSLRKKGIEGVRKSTER
ncbi:MAG TPA: SDR family oxidoreductase [Patescibacteria group bacterium]|nr:SDR family oxidoreductase [Patescibacteria group bacterium]